MTGAMPPDTLERHFDDLILELSNALGGLSMDGYQFYVDSSVEYPNEAYRGFPVVHVDSPEGSGQRIILFNPQSPGQVPGWVQ